MSIRTHLLGRLVHEDMAPAPAPCAMPTLFGSPRGPLPALAGGLTASTRAARAGNLSGVLAREGR